MLAALRITCSLLKLRIGIAIAASALAGIAASEGPPVSLLQSGALVLAVLGAAGAAGAFNHYYDRGPSGDPLPADFCSQAPAGSCPSPFC
jgi:protoheme IX farnesyltransferase